MPFGNGLGGAIELELVATNTVPANPAAGVGYRESDSNRPGRVQVNADGICNLSGFFLRTGASGNQMISPGNFYRLTDPIPADARPRGIRDFGGALISEPPLALHLALSPFTTNGIPPWCLMYRIGAGFILTADQSWISLDGSSYRI